MLEAFIALVVTFLLAPLMIRLGKILRIQGVDVHKPWRPLIPKTGGLAIVIGVALGVLTMVYVHGDMIGLPILLSCLIASAIGLIEDVKGEINPRLKPFLLVFASLPILVSGAFTPRPVIPFLGKTRLYKVYPLMVMAAYPIVCNAVNSVDVLNGSMILTSLPFFAMSLIIFYLRGDYMVFIIALILLTSLLALYPYNRYPARVFIGNSGSLFVGAAMASIAIVGRLEIAAIIALLPQIMNEMHVIFSLGGIKSAKYVEKRPINVENGFLTASKDKNAPITLLRMLCAEAKVDEKSAVYAMALISIFTAALGLITDLVFIEGVM